MQIKSVIVINLIFSILSYSCSKTGEPSGSQKPETKIHSSQPEQSALPEIPTRIDPPSKNAHTPPMALPPSQPELKTDVPQKQKKETSANPSPFKGLPLTLSLVVFNSKKSIQAEDFIIGKIASDSEYATGSPGDITRKFLISLKSKKPDSSVLAESDRFIIVRSLIPWIDSASTLTEFRISNPDFFETDRVSLGVRLFGSPGSAEGEIALSRVEDAWKIDTFNVNLEDMMAPAISPQTPFEPQFYHMTEF